MNANPVRQIFTIAQIGHAYIPETQNAASIANLLQAGFEFVLDTTSVKFDAAKYQLPNGAIDFVTGIRDLKDDEDLTRRLSGELILMTSDPDSDLESATDYAHLPLHEQCYFYHDSFPFAKNLAIISTYIWQHLPIVEGVQATAAGKRDVQPYLLYSFGMIALNRCLRSPLPHHSESRGCPLDYCEVVGDIDRFLIHGRGFCSDCKRLLQERQRDGDIHRSISEPSNGSCSERPEPPSNTTSSSHTHLRTSRRSPYRCTTSCRPVAFECGSMKPPCSPATV